MAPLILSASMPSRKGTFGERFWSKVDRGGPDDCWLWTAKAKCHGGYGAINYGGRGSPRLRAHRVAYELTFGPIPEGLVACHRCDVPRCCNPAHLFLGTKADNTHDMMAKGRMKKPPVHRGDDHPLRRNPAARRPGESNGNARHTSEKIAKIWADPLGTRAAARKYGVSTGLVLDVRNSRTWRHLTSTLPPREVSR